MGEVLYFISHSGSDCRLEGKRESVPDPDVLAAALSPLAFCPTPLSRLLLELPLHFMLTASSFFPVLHEDLEPEVGALKR